MGKWLAGILAAVLGGSILWFLTNRLYPNLFRNDPPPAAPPACPVECTPSPATIAPGATTGLVIKVTRGGVPVEGAAVYFDAAKPEESARTGSGGIWRQTWTAPNPAAPGYVFPVYSKVDGVRTSTEELFGSAGTDCQVLVR